MSSMEIDIPQVNGLPLDPPTSSSPKKAVQFNDINQVKVYDQTIEMRPKHKARRRAKFPHPINVETEQVENGDRSPSSPQKPISPARLKKVSEKDRHSRTGRRGLPKKGGAGGKGTWGKLTEMYEEDGGHTRDAKDPNYESDSEELCEVSPSSPPLSMEDFQKHGEVLFREYFDHGDTQEVAESLNEFNIHNHKPEVICLLVAVALEEKAAKRELASLLLSDLYGKGFNSRDFAAGFDLLLSQLDELSLDTPDAPDAVGNFIARCVADDCIPPAYVNNHTEVTQAKAVAAVKRAQLLLGMKHGMARLDNVWGVGGGQRPVRFLVGKMNLLLREYLSSGDKDEAVRCLSELEVPHFHHELVYEAIMLVLEDGSERCLEMMTSLVLHMAQGTILTRDQINQGFIRVFNDITDIVLDVPNAYHTLSKFVEKGTAAGFVIPTLSEETPQRGRKRFVSEGDGGAIKAPED